MKPSQAREDQIRQIVEAWYGCAVSPSALTSGELEDLIAAIADAPCKECAEKAARIQQQDIFIRNDHEGECVDNEIVQTARIATLETEIRDINECDKCDLCEDHHEPVKEKQT